MGGTYWSSEETKEAVVCRLDWRPDIRTPTDQRMIIRNTKYGNVADLFGPTGRTSTQSRSATFWEKHDPARLSPSFKTIQLVQYHCGAAYAVAIACQLCLFLKY